jgi:hypothetical protein
MPSHPFKVGDVVTTNFSKDSRYFGYKGLIFKVTYIGPYIAGNLLKFPEDASLFANNKIGDEINWYDFSSLISVESEQIAAEDKYFSPFSGKWV